MSTRFTHSLLLALLVVGPIAAQPPAQSTIRVVLDNNYPPYVFTDKEGKLQGILVDQWQLWEHKTGLKVQMHALDWAEALRRMRAGEFDVIDTVFKTQEREAYWDFSKPYARIDVLIFFQKDIAGIAGLGSLQGFPVAVKAGDAAEDLLRQNGIATVLTFNSYEAIIEAAKQRKVNVFVMDEPPAQYLLNKWGIHDEFRQSAPASIGQFRRAVKKGNTDLMNTIERGFAALNGAELKQIEEKWYGRTIGSRLNLRYLGYIAASGVLLVLGLVTWNVVLNRLVSRRTAALQEKESRLRRINRTLRMISECNQVLVRATDETGLLQAICRLIVEAGGYRMAWVGFAEQDGAKTVRPVAQAGFEAGYLDTVNITWADTERGRGPTGTAIRSGQPVIARNIQTDPTFAPWREAATQRGYAASATLPLKRKERTLGALMVYSAEPSTFDTDEVALLADLANDLAYGVTALRARTEQERVEEQLRRLSAHLLEVQDQERRHLARELHDTTAQHLAALTLNLANLKGQLSTTAEPTRALCRDSIQLANQAAQEIRTHSYLLHPPVLDVMGLAEAVEEYAHGLSARSGIVLEVDAPRDFGRLPEALELALFRVVQESLANVLKHSHSPRARIRFTRREAIVTLEVEDMGQGMPSEKLARLKGTRGGSGVGIGGMQERLRLLGGRLDLESSPAGTKVCATVPLGGLPTQLTTKT